MATNQYVQPSKGGWEVVKEGHRRGAVRTATKKDAIAQARTIVRNAGGGQVRVMDSHGKLTSADTVGPSRATSGNRNGRAPRTQRATPDARESKS
jgi:hypothetical protein